MLEKEQLLPSISPTLTLGSSPGGAQPTVLRCGVSLQILPGNLHTRIWTTKDA